MASNYIAITPARDEQALLPQLIDSMTSQTVSASRWIVIDDGSTDATPEILDEAAAKHKWIEVRHLNRGRPRAAGGESVIMQFLPRELWTNHDHIFRLDADLSFGPQLVEMLLTEFEADPKLGIAGATLEEPSPQGWRELRSPSFHTHGAAKMYSRACFGAIGGLEAGEGWDTLDEVKAIMLGFRSHRFKHIRARHHRPQGSAGGAWRGRISAGRTAYRIGYSPAFLLARAGAKFFNNPPIIGSILLLIGYCQGYFKGIERPASPELIKFIRREQLRRLTLRPSAWR
jgi:biofilm PGA synthesis N-glycosyltransferase PgaC